MKNPGRSVSVYLYHNVEYIEFHLTNFNRNSVNRETWYEVECQFLNLYNHSRFLFLYTGGLILIFSGVIYSLFPPIVGGSEQPDCSTIGLPKDIRYKDSRQYSWTAMLKAADLSRAGQAP